jgi:hypothetical protein
MTGSLITSGKPEKLFMPDEEFLDSPQIKKAAPFLKQLNT